MTSEDKATSKGSQTPRRRRQSASGAVDRLTNVMGRDKPQTQEEETTATEDVGRDEEQSPLKDTSNDQSDEEEIKAEAQHKSSSGSGKAEKIADTASNTKKDRVRASVDLSRDQHKFLKMFAVQNDSDGMSILRELVEMLEEEDDISNRLLQRLHHRE